MDEQSDYTGQVLSEIIAKIRDLEGKQRASRDRLLLAVENLIDLKETTNSKMLELKKDVEKMKQDIERMSSFLETVSSEFSRFAKKEDLEILIKQAKMFQPLKLMDKKDLERLKNI